MRIAKNILELLFWMLAAGVLLFGVGVAIGVVVGPPAGYLAAVAMLALLPMLVRMAQTLRRRRAAAAIAYLEQAVRLNLPLSRMLYAAQRGERGPIVERLGMLRQLLEDGHSVGAAVEVALPEVAERDAALIEASERIGRLPQALHAIVAQHAADAARRHSNELTFYRTYPFVMAAVTASVLAMLMIFVIPKYEQIFRDFAMTLPPITTGTPRAARVAGPLVLAAVAAAVLVWTGAALWQMFRPVRFASVFGGGVIDRVVWATPVAHGIARDRGLADALTLVAGALDNGVTIERALGEASTLDINRVLQERLTRWAEGVMGGMGLAEAARAAPMPPIVAGMLASALGAGAAAEVFRFLGRYYHTRYSRVAALVQGATVPIVVFVFAAIVTCVALSLFLPITSMIDHLAATVQEL